MPLDHWRFRKLGATLNDFLKQMRPFSIRKRSSVVRTDLLARRASNADYEPSASFSQVPPPSLPVELWAKIFQELGPKEWIVLCRVSRLLHQIAQPCLYEDIKLRISEDLDSFITDRSDAYYQLQFKRTIDWRPELGAYVRSLNLDMVDRAGPYHWKRHPLLSELDLFPSLESLRVWHIHFDLELCNILHSRPRLKYVTLAGCTLDESLTIAGIDQDHFPNSSISTVEVLYPKNNPLIHAWAALAPGKLESFAVHSITSPAPDSVLILNRIRESNKTSFLTTLSLNTFSPAVVRFLVASPQLRHFKLNTWVDEYNLVSSSLPADAIPLLEEYSGPAEISSTFIRRRPVHTVKLILPGSIPEDSFGEILNSLQYSTVHLRSLELNLSNTTIGSWLSHIPVTVWHLTFDYIDWITFTKWLPALSHLTSLRTLSGKFAWQPKEKLHRDEIMQISNTCPSLREIDIGLQRWHISGKRVWEPFMVFTD